MFIPDGSFAQFNEDFLPRIKNPTNTGTITTISGTDGFGARLASGIFASVNSNGVVRIYNPDLTLIKAIAAPVGTITQSDICASDTLFYVFTYVTAIATSTMRVFNASGDLVDTKLIPAYPHFILHPYVTLDDTILYYTTDSDESIIRRYDLIGDAPLTDFQSRATYVVYGILVLPDLSVIVSWGGPIGDGSDDELIHYDSLGSILHARIDWTTENGAPRNLSITQSPYSNIFFWGNNPAGSYLIKFELDSGSSDINTITTLPEIGGGVHDFFLMDGVNVALSGIYQLVPQQRHDTFYTSYDPIELEDRKIPDPSFDLGYIGDE